MITETTSQQGTFELPAEIVEIKGDNPWPVTRSRTGPWIGICEPLKLTTQAETWSEFMSDISWAMEAVFEDLLKTGDPERFLRERGWTTRPVDTPRARFQTVKFDFPFCPRMVDPGDQAQTLSVQGPRTAILLQEKSEADRTLRSVTLLKTRGTKG